METIAACDRHDHIIGPAMQYALAPERDYTPEEATVEACQDLFRRLGQRGCNWPHPRRHLTLDENQELLALLDVWVGDERIRRRIFEKNPACLYDLQGATSGEADEN
ncbi:MAG: hypothetical protein HYY78_10995 [Betaproteobacteria bacterium]|nr:hypothetical protein [Betaproteobacteria bacterium]